jgi:hypothetical protein
VAVRWLVLERLQLIAGPDLDAMGESPRRFGRRPQRPIGATMRRARRMLARIESPRPMTKMTTLRTMGARSGA